MKNILRILTIFLALGACVPACKPQKPDDKPPGKKALDPARPENKKFYAIAEYYNELVQSTYAQQTGKPAKNVVLGKLVFYVGAAGKKQVKSLKITSNIEGQAAQAFARGVQLNMARRRLTPAVFKNIPESELKPLFPVTASEINVAVSPVAKPCVLKCYGIPVQMDGLGGRWVVVGYECYCQK